MEAIEKAQELVEKFRRMVDPRVSDEHGLVYSRDKEQENAKLCALIVVEEMINEIKLMFPEPYKNQYKYWEHVKSKIELL